MAWVRPVFDRSGVATKTTHTDMNRICGNINYLWATLLSDDYTVSDIVEKSDWDDVIDYTNEIAELMEMDEVTSSTKYDNLNAIEEIAFEYWSINPLFPVETLYPDADIYPR